MCRESDAPSPLLPQVDVLGYSFVYCHQLTTAQKFALIHISPDTANLPFASELPVEFRSFNFAKTDKQVINKTQWSLLGLSGESHLCLILIFALNDISLAPLPRCRTHCRVILPSQQRSYRRAILRAEPDRVGGPGRGWIYKKPLPRGAAASAAAGAISRRETTNLVSPEHHFKDST